MTRTSLLVAIMAAFACSSNVLTVATGEFTAPTGIAATAAGDRDLFFVANTGRDSLRALQLCNYPLLLDGGVDPADTCPKSEHGQFVPAPIRLFPASIETGNRPLRVAGVRLNSSDGGAAGVALVAGSTSKLAVVDARSFVEAQTTGIDPRPVDYLDLGDLGADAGTPASETVDVVAANPLDRFDLETGATKVTAFAATRTELVVLDVTLGGDFAQPPAVRGHCTLDPVVPMKLAVVPGSDAQVYVADGAGDGVVAIQASSVTSVAGPCVMDRISAGGRSVRSIALSPPRYDQDGAGAPRTRVAGELLLMVLEPLAAVASGQTPDPGGLLIAGTGLGLVPKGIVPIPPFDLAEAGEPMRPLNLPTDAGLFSEVSFLRAVKPKPAAEAPDLTACPTAPCTPLSVAQSATPPVPLFALLAAVSCTDGVTYFIDVPHRRLVNQNLYTQANDIGILPVVNGSGPLFSPVVATSPTLTLDATKFDPGVTRQSAWRVTWHSAIPGLERRGGALTPVDSNTMRFTVALPNLNLYRDDPAIALAPGDVVSLTGYSIGTVNSPECQTVASSETAFRFELTIKDVQPDHLDLQTLPDNGTTRGFNLGGCTSLGAVAEVRTARTQPWLVFDGSTVKGRVKEDGTFEAHQRRFDYPRGPPGTTSYGRTDTDVPPAPVASRDTAFTFAITGPEPTVPASQFTWSFSAGFLGVAYGDQVHSTPGLATAVYGYSSRRTQNLAFTSVTGMDEVLQADPSLLSSTTTFGVTAYR